MPIPNDVDMILSNRLYVQCSDVTMATIDTTVVHIKIKPSKFCNPVRPPATVSTSNSRQICMRAPFWVHEYLMESSRSHLSNGSSFITKFHPSRPKSQKEAHVSARPSICLFGTPLYRVSIHLCASCLSSNSDCFYLVLACFFDLLVGIRLICTGKINNPRRGVSIAKTQRNVLYGCSRVVNVSPKSYLSSTHRKIGPTTAVSVERNSGFIRWYQSFRCSRLVRLEFRVLVTFCTTVVATTVSLLLSGPTKTESACCHGSIFVVFKSFYRSVLVLHEGFVVYPGLVLVPWFCFAREEEEGERNIEDLLGFGWVEGKKKKEKKRIGKKKKIRSVESL
ncbi:OSJNBa0042P21.24 [Oryza sativa (japonica cultivar-group)]